jgi:cytochrome c oxidase cbb3-type subunit 4
MLKFVKHHMETIVGIEIYPILSFIIFATMFAAVIAYVIWQRKSHFDHMGMLPMEDGHIDNLQN